MKITLCTPTRRRPDRFARMVASVNASATDLENVEIVACLDNGEPEYPVPGVKYIHVDRPTQDGNTMMSGLWSRAWEAGSGDIAMMCADDVVFETLGWDERVRAAFASVPDRFVMVYAHAKMEDRPVLPFVSREWIDAVGFTPDDLQGWFSDEWIWNIAAEVGRVIFLNDVIISHEQWGQDETYVDGMRAREHLGGLEAMRKNFYSIPNVKRRDVLRDHMQEKILGGDCMDANHCAPEPAPQWLTDTLTNTAATREYERKIQEETLVVVHAYSGDKDVVKTALPVHLAHNGHVLILSPSDAPVNIRRAGVECRSAGGRGYFGQVSLDRQRAHLEMLLEYPKNYFLLNDADSMCLTPYIPKYLYDRPNIAWSNQVNEWRPHYSPYPKIAMQPPYFLSREAIVRMLSVADNPRVRAHPITPFIDWYMLALCEEAGVDHRNFEDGASFPAWGWDRNTTPDTTEMGNDWKWENKEHAEVRGDEMMRDRVAAGVVMVHSVKHPEVVKMLRETHADYVRRGSPTPKTLTLDQYFAMKQDSPEETVRIPLGSWQHVGDIIQL